MAIGYRDPQSYGAQGFVNGDRNIDMPMPARPSIGSAQAMRGRPLPEYQDPRLNRVIRGQQPAGMPTGSLFPPPPPAAPPASPPASAGWGGWPAPTPQTPTIGTVNPAAPAGTTRTPGPFTLDPRYAGSGSAPSMAQATGAAGSRRQPNLRSNMGMSLRDKYAAALGG